MDSSAFDEAGLAEFFATLLPDLLAIVVDLRLVGRLFEVW
jgi:hypothetical protein